jgi:Fe-Mn family superoxide dismutase
MFGPGFVWLVKVGDKYTIMNTYIAGSPYAGAHWRRQGRDMNTEADNSSSGLTRQNVIDSMPVANAVGAYGPLSANKTAPGGISVLPILCVSTWQHVYMMDWGLSNKKQFLEAWWDKIDWQVVADTAGVKTGQTPFATR